MIDRYELRPVVVLTTAAGCCSGQSRRCSATPGCSAPRSPPGAVAAGVHPGPAGHRGGRAGRAAAAPAYALDSMSVEISYMTGPAAGALLTVWLGSAVSMRVIGSGFVLAGLALWWLNPPVRAGGAASGPAPARPPVRTWLSPRWWARC
ncbi:hypothetical protein HBB16_09300 [Pseudonocardia sp. MCCB 268]|nr:hypothetical protein [Pseudonocardia cytotoxica]